MAEEINCDEPPCNTDGECCDEKKQQIKDCCKKDDVCPSWNEGRTGMGRAETVTRYYEQVANLSDDQKKCFEKRKCLLHKFSSTDPDGNACCPGQTGHHIIPGATFTGLGFCYQHGQALTVCAAGASNDVGRHGLMHALTYYYYSQSNSQTLSISSMLDKSLNAMECAFTAPCDWICLKQELETSYSEMNRADKKSRVNASDNRNDCTAITPGTMLDWHSGYSGNAPSAALLQQYFSQCIEHASSYVAPINFRL